MSGCYNPNACYPNNCYPNKCYNPSSSSCYPINPYACAPPQPCSQTCFRAGDALEISIAGTIFNDAGLDNSCSNVRNLQINGSGLSIVAVCGATGDGTGGEFISRVAGNICSCPNSFSATINISDLAASALDGASGAGGNLVGSVNFTVCGGSVIGQGSVEGVVAKDITDLATEGGFLHVRGTVCITGCVCSSCGTRNVTINNIVITTSYTN